MFIPLPDKLFYSKDRTCPDDCTDPTQGTCDSSTGLCTCMTGFTGTNCAGKKMKFKACYFFILFFEPTLISLPNKLFSLKDRTCPDDCTDPTQGTCDSSTGVCTCLTGFTGANCAGKKMIL